MVGTRRNKSAAANDLASEPNKPKKLTKAQLKQMDDVSPVEGGESNDPERSGSALGRRLTKAEQKQMEPEIERETTSSPVVVAAPKRGRPRKNTIIDAQDDAKEENDDTKEPKKRGRPRKSDLQVQVKAVEQIKSEETDTGSMSSESNSNSPVNRRLSNRLKKKVFEEATSEKDSISVSQTTDIEEDEAEILIQEEAAGEELIEIVVEEHTSSSIDSNDQDDVKSAEPVTSPIEPENFDISEANSPEISVEIIEDSNSISYSTSCETKREETPKPDSDDDVEGIDQEDDVSIVYLDENDDVLNTLDAHFVSDSDATMDSVDLQSHISHGKSKRSKKQERAFERLKNESFEILRKMDQMDEESVKETSKSIDTLEEQIQNIQIEEPEHEPIKSDIDQIEKPPSPKEEQMNVDETSLRIDQDESTKTSLDEDPKEDTKQTETEENNDENSTSIRRSRRIKTISTQNRRSVGHGLVKDREKFLKKTSEESLSNQSGDPLKVKSRWRRLSELQMSLNVDDLENQEPGIIKTKEEIEEEKRQERICEERLKHFVTIKENEYKCDRNISKEAKKMLCDCFLTQEEYDRGEHGCGEDCLNRLLMIECGQKCNIKSRCTNRRFQNAEYSNCKVFRTEKKGFGIAAATDIQPNEFIMEYVGEVLDSYQFEKRANDYSNDKNKHYYFMALRSDAVIDATTRGNISRFINHSCDPNAETQKWTVNGELRIGFFSTRFIPAGEEITFDYQFQRYGKEAQKCYCEAATCRGWIGQAPGEDGSEAEDSETESEVSDAEKEGKKEISFDENVKIQEQKASVKEKKEKAKVAGKKRAYRRKKRQEILDDLDLDDEINILCRSGLKNQQHTLKLSRLMVRAKLLDARTKLLSLLTNGELPCRRLFLDYHGLRLLHGWMEDSQDVDQERLLNFRKSILVVLDVLPITNKTILKDSKVLSTVQKWASEHNTSPNSSSPNDESSGSGTATPLNDTNKETMFNSEMFKHIPDLIKQSEQLIKTIGVDELKHIINTCGIREHVQKEKEEKLKQKETAKEASIDEVSSQEIEPKMEEVASDDTKPVVTEMEVKETPEVTRIETPKEEDLSNKTPEEVKVESTVETPETVMETPVETPIEPVVETPVETVKEELEKPNEDIKENITPKIESESFVTQPEETEFKALKDEICQLAKKLLNAWKDLKESFRIPKKERLEQMKEHEREADLRYKSLNLVEQPPNKDRFTSSRYSSRDKERERYEPREPTFPKVPKEKSHFLSKEQRRHLFEMKVAQQEHERRQQELWYCHEQNCLKFGLNPRHLAPHDVPAMMNPITGQYYTADRRPLPTPPSHQYMKFIPPPLPTNPAEYELPLMDLPPFWKFAIDERGRIYYYHVKIRIPQWKPPIKIQPLSEPTNDEYDDDIQLTDEGSESSDTDTCDSEEEELKEKLEILQKCKEKSKTQFNLDDLLAKPGDLNDEDEEKRLGPIPSIEETNNLIGAQVKADILNTASNFNRSLDIILPNLKRMQRKRSGLVQERSISPRTEEDKIRGHLEMRKYKETKEKLRRRKEEMRRRQLAGGPGAVSDASGTSDPNIRMKIVDELDILHSSEVKRPSAYEEWKVQEQKIRLEKKRQQQEIIGDHAKRKKISDVPIVDLHSEEARRIKEKFRIDIAGVIKYHLRSYMSEDCKKGRITNSTDFKHLARKLTHFVMLKELKHCGNTIGQLEVTDSVKSKAREFIKKYMAKFDEVYKRPEGEPDFRE